MRSLWNYLEGKLKFCSKIALQFGKIIKVGIRLLLRPRQYSLKPKVLS